MWSSAWNSRLGCALALDPGALPRRRSRAGRGRRSATRSTSVCRVSPYVAMAAIRTVPCSSVTSSGSRTTVAPALRGLGDAAVDVGHLEGDVDDAVAVPAVVVGQRAVGVDGAVDDEADRAGAQHERLVVAVAVLGAGVGLQLHAPRGLVVVRGLGGVADDEDDRVPAGDREDVAVLVVLHEADQLLELLEGQVGLELVGGQRVRSGESVMPRSMVAVATLCATVRRNTVQPVQSEERSWTIWTPP